ncbi:MAG: hypothetical protein CMI29_06475 [Opitutae bacterium]|nr:hypothetical protein [Opitutae bacterium]
MITIKVSINGSTVTAPVEWEDIQILSTFDNGAVQANITVEELTFVLSAYDAITEYIKSGLDGGNGIFEGIPLQILAYNDSTTSIFDGYIDLTEGLVIDTASRKLTARIKKRNGLNSLEERVQGITARQLLDEGHIPPDSFASLDYTVVQPFDPLQTAITSVLIYTLVKDGIDQIENLTDKTATTSGFASSPPFGAVGAAVFTALTIIAQIAFIVATALAVANLINSVLAVLIPPKREHKVVKLSGLLKAVASKLGYAFNTSERIFDKLYYLASNINVDQATTTGLLKKAGTVKDGIPNTADYGYSGTEILELAKNLCAGRYSVIDNTIELHNENSDFYKRLSTYKAPSVLATPTRYNTDEVFANFLLAFSTDPADLFTLQDFKGTSYQVSTSPIATTNADAVTIKGLEELRIPVALASRRTELNFIEDIVSDILGVFDGFLGIFGIEINVQDLILRRLGAMQVSSNNHTVPKLLILNNSKIPSNHRDILSAKAIYEKSYTFKSFVANGAYGQKRIFSNVRVPFGQNDFNSLIDNNYFIDAEGREARATRIEWNIAGSEAVLDYYVREPYTFNLKEEKFEPS